MNVTGNILPGLNLTYDLGAPDETWNNIYGKSIYSGDLILENEFRLTEGNKVGEDPNSLVFLNENGEKIMKLDSEGNLWLKGDIKKFGE